MDRHRENAAQGTGDQGDSRFTIVCHADTLDKHEAPVTMYFRAMTRY
jgi:hypothetical protein